MNDIGFISYFFLAFYYSPQFVYTSDADAVKGIVHPCTLWTMLYYSVQAPLERTKENAGMKLKTVLENSFAPIALLPEVNIFCDVFCNVF